MELLIAIFIFAIVISAVYGAYNATFKIVHGAEQNLAITRNARVALERMIEDLDSIVISPGSSLHGERHDQSDGTRGDSLAFISSAHLALSKADIAKGYARISYSVERNDADGFLDLYRSDTLLLPGVDTKEKEARKEILAKGLKEVEFSYLDEDGKELEEWQGDEEQQPGEQSGQQSETSLPALVYLQLTFADALDSKGGTIFKTAVALTQNTTDK